MTNTFPGGVWPTMLTPFTPAGTVDYNALELLVEWYIGHGVSGLFAVCQSSEMFQLSLEERLAVARLVVKKAQGRVPVIASGHISDRFDDQAAELSAMAKTGVQAVILITNRLARQEDSEGVWLANLQTLLKRLPETMPLGFYECPQPYKRLISLASAKWCAESERFFFLKDTCCDLEQITERLEVLQGSNLKLYNANTSTLLDSLRRGAWGYSGVMANFQPDLYAWLCAHYEQPEVEALSDALSICSLIERQLYPVNAKYSLKLAGLPVETACRVKDEADFTPTFQEEVHMLQRVTKRLEKQYIA